MNVRGARSFAQCVSLVYGLKSVAAKAATAATVPTPLIMDTQSSSRRALKPAQEQEVAEDRRRPRNKRDRARRAAETAEQMSEKAKGERSC